VRVPEREQDEALPGPGRLGLGSRPRFLTAGALRLGVLCALIIAIGMLSPRMTADEAGQLVIVGALAVLAAAGVFLLATRRTAERLRRFDVFRPTEVVLIVIRRTGLPLLGLAFFLVWTFVYVAVWAFHPTGPEHAFDGLDAAPRFADFFYYAVSTAFISPPGDIVASSRGARTGTMIEMLTGLALITAYAGSFVDWHGRRTGDGPDPEARGE
jgi:hypothetical protein